MNGFYVTITVSGFFGALVPQVLPLQEDDVFVCGLFKQLLPVNLLDD